MGLRMHRQVGALRKVLSQQECLVQAVAHHDVGLAGSGNSSELPLPLAANTSVERQHHHRRHAADHERARHTCFQAHGQSTVILLANIAP
jgi:hypothetical protein